MVWIDCKAGNEIVSNIQDIRRSHGVYRENHEKVTAELTAVGKSSAEEKIQRRIFQRKALSPFLLVICNNYDATPSQTEKMIGDV